MFFCNVSEKYNNDIELLCNNNSICIVFEYNSGNRFLKDINIVANRAKNSINEFSDRLLKEYGFKNDKIGNIYCFYQDEFIMPPFCSCGELINYLDVLGKILININYGRYNLINGKLVSIDQEEIEGRLAPLT